MTFWQEYAPALAIWGAAVVTGWLAFVAYLRWKLYERGQQKEAQAQARRASLLGAFASDDGREISDAKAAFEEEITRLRARIERQYGGE